MTWWLSVVLSAVLSTVLSDEAADGGRYLTLNRPAAEAAVVLVGRTRTVWCLYDISMY